MVFVAFLHLDLFLIEIIHEPTKAIFEKNKALIQFAFVLYSSSRLRAAIINPDKKKITVEINV